MHFSDNSRKRNIKSIQVLPAHIMFMPGRSSYFAPHNHHDLVILQANFTLTILVKVTKGLEYKRRYLYI